MDVAAGVHYWESRISLLDTAPGQVTNNGIGRTMPGFKAELFGVERLQAILYLRGLGR